MPRRANAIFFDLDDTLIEWQKVHISAFREAVRRINTEFPDIDARVIGGTMEEVSRQAIKDLNFGNMSFDRLPGVLESALVSAGISQEAARRLYPNYIAMLTSDLEAYTDCDVLYELSEDFVLGVISDGPKEWQIAKLKMTGLHPLFDTVICSSEFGVCKPDKRIFNIACTSAGVHPDKSIMVGNNPHKDAIGAREAGLFGIWLNRGNAALSEQLQTGAMIHTLYELKNILDEVTLQ